MLSDTKETQRISNFLSHELEILRQQASNEAQQQNNSISSNVRIETPAEKQIRNFDSNRLKSNSSGFAQASKNTNSSSTTSVENRLGSQGGTENKNGNKGRNHVPSPDHANAGNKYEQKAKKWHSAASRVRFSRSSAKNKVAAGGGLPELFHLPTNNQKVRPVSGDRLLSSSFHIVAITHSLGQLLEPEAHSTSHCIHISLIFTLIPMW